MSCDFTICSLPSGAAHAVDSSEMAFKLAAIGAIREGEGVLETMCGTYVEEAGHKKC